MSESSISVSLEDLLSSGALTNSTFLLKNESSTSAPHLSIATSDFAQMQMLNAAKISLLIARAFTKHQLGAHSPTDASSLQIGDFLIHLGFSLPPPAANGTSADHSLSDVLSHQPGNFPLPLDHTLPPSPDGLSSPTEDLELSLEGQEDSDTSLQFISEFFDMDKPLPQWTHQQQSLQQTSTSTPHSNSEPSGRDQMRRMATEIRNPTPSISLHDVLSAEGFDRMLTLISIDCNPSTGKFLSDTTPEQTLGDLIHCIFSGGNLRFSSTLSQQPPENIGSNSDARAAKMKSNETLFSSLVGVGTLPVTVCRLLSDLSSNTSITSMGKFNSSCTISVQEVIEDLEHMCAYPQIYLYDPETEFYSTNLLFGQRLYGRKTELTQMLGITTRIESGLTSCGAECILVSGGGGSGKSHLVNNVTTFLSNIGWIVSSASCGRDMGHRSSETVLTLLDTLIVNIVAVYNSEGRSAMDALLSVIDSTTLRFLSAYLPSLRSVSGNTDRRTSPNNLPEISQLQLNFLLSRLMGAILSLDRRVLLFLDNFEHVDSSALDLLSEMLTSVGRLPNGRSHFLFIGCYREGIGEGHPLTAHIAEFRLHQDIILTEISLNKLSMDDVTDIIMTELRLPRRLVMELASIVHKKTSGHALFVVQLLNSLVRDSVLAYSPMKRRFDWDSAKVRSLKTADNVASLIVSNLNSLNAGEQHSLRVVSCFGIQVKLSLLALLKDTCPYGGIEPHLKSLVEGGVVEMKDSLVVFSHDLIQQGVYNSIPEVERQQLHLNIAVTLGMKVSLDQHSVAGQIEEIDFNRLSFVASRNMQSKEINAIIGIATNQVNRVDPKSIELSQRIRFARWNMVAASQFSKSFNFGASAHYCRKGIGLLYDYLWCNETCDLCRALNEGVASASLFLGDISDAQHHANILIEKLPFADSLAAQYILLRSWEVMGKYEEQVARSLDVLRGLKLDIPTEPSPSFTMEAMALTSSIASKYSIDQISNLRTGKVDKRRKYILQSLNSILTGAFRSSSPFLPLIICAFVKYSLQNGVYEESALSFACLGYFKIALLGDYNEARYWANATLNILKMSNTINSINNRTGIVLHSYLQWFFVPLQETLFSLLSINKSAAAMGDVQSAIYSMLFSLRFSFYAGENLSLLLNSFCELLRTMKRYKEIAKVALIYVVLIETLTGTKSNAFDIFEGTIPSENFILADAKARQNVVYIQVIHTRRFFTSFWFGDYQAANDLYDTTLSHTQPSVHSIPTHWFRGIIAYQLYREGEGEEWLEEGNKMLQKFEDLVKLSTTNSFECKLLLLRAEYYASSCEIIYAKVVFNASIKSARDHGFIHDQGLAYECYGKFLASIVDNNTALNCFKSAHMCYLQWGALALAEHVWNKYNLNTFNEGVSQILASSKHDRSWQ